MLKKILQNSRSLSFIIFSVILEMLLNDIVLVFLRKFFNISSLADIATL